MGKIIWKEPSEDDRIFKTGFVISSPNLQTGFKQSKKKSSEITDGQNSTTTLPTEESTSKSKTKHKPEIKKETDTND